MTKSWWKSVEDRQDAPEAVARRGREFAEPLPIGPIGEAEGSEASRRDFMKLMGFSAAAAGLAGCRAPVRRAVPFVEQPEEMTSGTSLEYATTCGGCAAGCGLVAKCRDGRVLKVEGLPGKDGSPGGTCAVGQASVLALYDEGRYRGPQWHGQDVSWREMDHLVSARLAAVAAAGGTIGMVTGTLNSPSGRAVLEAFRERFPTTRWVAYEPLSTRALGQAQEELSGQPGLPRYRFERARAVVGLDADFLGTWFSPVEHARGWAQRRRPGDDMSWHGQFESRLSPTGAVADRRTPVTPADLDAVAVALWERLRRRVGRSPADEARLEVAGVDPARLDEAADALWSHRGESLVVCGSNDVAVQRVVAGMNALLGNLGSTVDVARPSRQSGGDEGDLVDLVDAMERGEVHALIVDGVDPAWDHPLAARFREALSSVSLVVSTAGRPNATSKRAHAVCPEPHFLEAWSDLEPIEGKLLLRQPAMAPLWNTRETAASLWAWTLSPEAREDAGDVQWGRWLEEHWRRHVLPEALGLETGRPAPARLWHQALHDGGLDTSAEPPSVEPPEPAELAPRVDAAAKGVLLRAREARRLRDEGAWEVVLYPKAAIRDGRWADNPWLQEMPDPVSRVTWSNYAALSPADAADLGVEDGDVVRLVVGETAVELPALIQPGQARRSVAVALGYGRREGGPAGRVGTDAWPLVGVEDGRFVYARTGGRVEPTGEFRDLAATQDHHLLEGRDIVREASLAAWRGDPSAGNHRPEHLPSLWPERPTPGHQWGLAIDLNACTGCGACVVACQAENNVPVVGPEEVGRNREMHWIRIDRYYTGSEDEPETVFQPMLCQHCDHAPCETVCPVLATVHSSDGLNQQIYNRCVGTRYCANNCPYKVRRFNWFNYTDPGRFDNAMTSELTAMVLNPDVAVRSRGVMEKCSMCIQRIQKGKLAARDRKRKLADGDIRTACQEACPTDAFVFGDLEDPESRVAEQFADGRFYHVLEELGVRPSVGYLTRVRHRWGEETPPGDAAEPEVHESHQATHGKEA